MDNAIDQLVRLLFMADVPVTDEVAEARARARLHERMATELAAAKDTNDREDVVL